MISIIAPMIIEEVVKFTSVPILNEHQKVVRVIDRAIIPIKIGYKLSHKVSKTPVGCLLDSGSDRNLFPAHWGESVGIKVSKGRLSIIRGIGGITIEGYEHFIDIYCGSKIKFSAHAIFSFQQQVPLLGRQGFFDNFKKIIFDEENGVVRLLFKNK